MGDENIERIYTEHQRLYAYLIENEEPSFASDLDYNFRKSFVLSIASGFENRICSQLEVFCQTHSNKLISNFVKYKGIKRQYHTFFTWDAKNANTFFSLFGEEFKSDMETYFKEDNTFAESVKSFLEIGNLRNQLVHQNYSIFPVDKTVDEIYVLYQKSSIFIEKLFERLEAHRG